MREQTASPKTKAKASAGPEQGAKKALMPTTGNLRHGAHAQPPAARVDALCAELAAAAPVRAAGGLPAHDAVAVRLAALTMARLEQVSEWVNEHGPLDAKGRPRSAALWERRLSATLLKQLTALGMTPQSRAKLGLNLARTVDLAQAMSEPDATRRAELLNDLGVGGGG